MVRTHWINVLPAFGDRWRIEVVRRSFGPVLRAMFQMQVPLGHTDTRQQSSQQLAQAEIGQAGGEQGLNLCFCGLGNLL